VTSSAPMIGGRNRARDIQELEARILGLNESIILALNQLLDLKDFSTGVHSTRLAEWAVRVGRNLGISERALFDVEMAALLHDIGKIGIPDAILQKPGSLSDEEFRLIKKHPEYGWAIIRLFPDFERASLLVLHHHERFDGLGYPAGLKGHEIPMGARIVAVTDSFDAMTSSRPYHPGMPFGEAIERLMELRGTQFDPSVVDCFVRVAVEEPAAAAPASALFQVRSANVHRELNVWRTHERVTSEQTRLGRAERLNTGKAVRRERHMAVGWRHKDAALLEAALIFREVLDRGDTAFVWPDVWEWLKWWDREGRALAGEPEGQVSSPLQLKLQSAASGT